MSKNGFYLNESTQNDILQHFSLCEDSVLKNLAKKVNINEYVNKIINFADRYEVWKDDILVAFIAVYTNKGPLYPAYITNVSVIKSEYSKGNGSNLMSTLIIDLKDKKFENIQLEVAKNNKRALSLYKEKGAIILYDKTLDSYLMNISLKNH